MAEDKVVVELPFVIVYDWHAVFNYAYAGSLEEAQMYAKLIPVKKVRVYNADEWHGRDLANPPDPVWEKGQV